MRFDIFFWGLTADKNLKTTLRWLVCLMRKNRGLRRGPALGGRNRRGSNLYSGFVNGGGQLQKVVVPRDGIEPPTRGFSIFKAKTLNFVNAVIITAADLLFLSFLQPGLNDLRLNVRT